MQACGRPCAGERPILSRRAMSADERGRCVQPRPSSRRDASRSARRVGSGSLYLAVKRITWSAADAIETRWPGETTSGLQLTLLRRIQPSCARLWRSGVYAPRIWCGSEPLPTRIFLATPMLGSPVATPKCEAMPSPRGRSEEHTSELQSLMRISYDVFCLKKKNILI